jgi:hypothetical protein
MKVKILIPDWGYEVGEIVEAKYFADMTEKERFQVNMGGKQNFLWDDDDLFVRTYEFHSTPWGFVYKDGCEVVE